MIIDNFHQFGGAVLPDEADSPLVVDADAVLPGAITFQQLKPIARRRMDDGITI